MPIAAAMASFAVGVLAGMAAQCSFTASVAVTVAAIFAAGVAVGGARSEKMVPKEIPAARSEKDIRKEIQQEMTKEILAARSEKDIQKEIQQEMTKEIPAGLSRGVVAEMKMRRWVVTDTGGKLHLYGMCGSTASKGSSSFKDYEMCKHCVKAISKQL